MKTMMNETPNEILTTNFRGNNKMKKFTKLFKNQKGLTLIELLAVIVILGIVAAIATPAIGNVIENSRYSAVKADATNALTSAQLYFTENADQPTVTVTDLLNGNYLESAGKIPGATTISKATPAVTGTNAVAAKAGSLTTTDPVKFSGEKGVKFTDATISGINEDTQKGSAATITAITK